MPDVREIADSFRRRWLAINPFAASSDGIPGYDDRVPDDSEGGEAVWRGELEAVLAESNLVDPSRLSDADGVTLGVCSRTSPRSFAVSTPG